MGYDLHGALGYEADLEHSLPDGEAEVWLDLLRGLSGGNSLEGMALDIGAGTGLLTLVLNSAGLDVIGLEPSTAMIARGLLLHPELSPSNFRVGEADDKELFPPARFDWLVSRQALCHLEDPASCLRNWRDWLRPGGFMVLVDGHWGAGSWTREQLAAQPFAAVTEPADVATMVAETGFQILRYGDFTELNLARTAALGRTVPRYLCIARR